MNDTYLSEMLLLITDTASSLNLSWLKGETQIFPVGVNDILTSQPYALEYNILKVKGNNFKLSLCVTRNFHTGVIQELVLELSHKKESEAALTLCISGGDNHLITRNKTANLNERLRDFLNNSGIRQRKIDPEVHNVKQIVIDIISHLA